MPDLTEPPPRSLSRAQVMSAVDTDDLAELEDLTDDVLQQCLFERYKADKIYTYVGNILIATNPFQWLTLYTSEISNNYTNLHNKTDHPPHLYAIADNAFQSMARSGRPQVCVISGESGAGKTESAKQFIRQIMDVSARGLMGGAGAGAAVETGAERARHPVETKIIQQNPILEAFGNAQTVMNDNSSRFGKFIELKFNSKNLVSGAEMSHYLLEKARIVQQGPAERNFHIFGMIFAGMAQASRDMYRLSAREDFRYVPDDDYDMGQLTSEWAELQQAFHECGFSDTEIDEMFSAVAAVLHFGNLDFEDGDRGDAAVVKSPEVADTLAHVLGVELDKLKAALLTEVVSIRGESITKHNNVLKATNARNATAKAVYDRVFRWLVYKINLTLAPADPAEARAIGRGSIGILDIFGFENFKQNGFDQMCINLANEQLHFFFNQHIFAAEIGSYADEGLELTADVMFADNKKVLDMFFRTPLGMLPLLDEQSRFDRATASTLLETFNKHLKEEPLFVEVKGNYAFEVVHYAGKIRYHTEGFLEKNTDPLPAMMGPVCTTSSNGVVRLMFTPDFERAKPELARGKSRFGGLFATKKKTMKSKRAGSAGAARSSKNLRPPSSKKARGGKKQAKEINTVSAAFRQSLALLMTKMGLCEPHFVRCIKPNPQKKPHLWDADLVLRQLTYTGMLQTVKMRREGYPHRVPFADFYAAYRGIVRDFKEPMRPAANTCTELLKELEAKVESHRVEQGLKTITTSLRGWLVGKTMVFLKYWQLDILDGMAHVFGVAAIRIQKLYRGHMARKRFIPIKQKYLDDCAAAATFIGEVSSRMGQIFNNLETLAEEEVRRGPIGLGIQEPPPPKVEKKAKKQEGQVQVNQKKFNKDLEKVKKAVVKWWLKFEASKGCHLDEVGHIYPWFHGLISRTDAEDYLFDQPSGSFLIRVSERVNGYALSFRFEHRIRHYKLGFSSNGGYEVVGCSDDFASLAELVEFYSKQPITPGEDDILAAAVPFDHDLGLGPSLEVGELAGKAPPKMSAEERREKTKSMVNLLDDESGGAPMSNERFLESADPPPRWLRGNLSRNAAEQELEDRGMVDGRFLVREKLRSADRVVLALSVTFRRKFYHHLLQRQTEGQWLLDEKPLDFNDGLEEVIRFLQAKKSPRLAGALELDVPAAPVDETLDADPTSPGNVARRKSSRRPPAPITLMPSDSSTVDDVVAWLASLGMARYAGAFYKAKMDGKRLHKATEKQLRKLVKSEDDYRLMVRALR